MSISRQTISDLAEHLNARRPRSHDRAAEPHAGDEIPIGHHRRWVSVVGSTGQPRDGSPKANYALFDVENESLYFHRVSYNHEMAAKKVQMHGLPDALAKRLLTGN